MCSHGVPSGPRRVGAHPQPKSIPIRYSCDPTLLPGTCRQPQGACTRLDVDHLPHDVGQRGDRLPLHLARGHQEVGGEAASQALHGRSAAR